MLQIKQKHDSFIKEHTSSNEKKNIKKNTKKADKSCYVISISCTDLCNKCLRFLEHLRVIGTKKVGKSINQKGKEGKLYYQITTIDNSSKIIQKY